MNHALDLFVWVGVGCLVVTKALDLYSTLKKLHTTIESNPLAKWLALRIGFGPMIGVLGLLSALVIAGWAYVALDTDQSWVKIAFVLGAIVMSIIHVATYKTNMTGQFNAVTLPILRLFGRLSQLIFRPKKRYMGLPKDEFAADYTDEELLEIVNVYGYDLADVFSPEEVEKVLTRIGDRITPDPTEIEIDLDIGQDE